MCGGAGLILVFGFVIINILFSSYEMPDSDIENCYNNECYKYIRLEQQTSCYKGCQNGLNNKKLYMNLENCYNLCENQYNYIEVWE